MRFFFILIYLSICISIFSEKRKINYPYQSEIKRIDSILYYKNHFKKRKRHPLADTLFSKIIWHKKVSHIILEETKKKIKVTLLMIMPYPYNYKSKNYAIYYEYSNYQKAFQKFTWLNQFLKKDGIIRVSIMGSKITSEKILYNPKM